MAPASDVLASVVVCASTSRTNTPLLATPTPSARLEAQDANATYRPSSLMAGRKLWLLAAVPAVFRLTRAITWASAGDARPHHDATKASARCRIPSLLQGRPGGVGR